MSREAKVSRRKESKQNNPNLKYCFPLFFLFIILVSTNRMSNSKDQTLLPQWNEELASQVSFADPTSGTGSDYRLVYASDILKLENISSGHVHDRIHVNDIIGVEIEFTMEESKLTSNDKAKQGQDKMEKIEQKIGEKLLSGSYHGDDVVLNDQFPMTSGSTAYLNIYAYPKALPKRGFFKQLKECIIGEDEESTEQNSHLKYGHRHEHHRRLKLAPVEDFAKASQLVQNIKQISKLSHRSQDRYLVIVNPFSGTKQGEKVYNEFVKKMLNEMGVEHDVLITQRTGHATERMMEQSNDDKQFDRDVKEYHTVIAMGGDGILSEIIHGIQKRSDFETIIDRLNFGIVGCGTSNGLAASINYAANEKYSPLESMFLISRGGLKTLDLSHYETASRTYTSFLTYSWAFIADVDIESELIRFMGILRNDIWAVWRLICLRTYRAKFSYVPNISSFDAEKDFPKLNENVPSDWITIEDDVIMFWASQVSHASTTTFQSPHSKLQDGLFTILIIRKPCSKLELLKILLGLENGTHLSQPKAEFFQCKAFRLEPISKGSFNDIDGEVVEPGRLQAFVKNRGLQLHA